MKIYFSTRANACTFAIKGKSKGLFRKVVDNRKSNGKWAVIVNGKYESSNTKYVLDKQL